VVGDNGAVFFSLAGQVKDDFWGFLSPVVLMSIFAGELLNVSHSLFPLAGEQYRRGAIIDFRIPRDFKVRVWFV
jgi:hypothetical protein